MNFLRDVAFHSYFSRHTFSLFSFYPFYMKHFFPIILAIILAGGGHSAAGQTKKKSSDDGGGSAGAGYTTGVGFRGGGWSSGLTVKHFLSGKNGVAFEGLLTTEYQARGARFTALLEKHKPIAGFTGLQFYYGAGAHLGTYKGRHYSAGRFYRNGKYKNDYYVVYYEDDRSYVVFGADLILGLEYKMPDLPFVLGVDYKPFFEVFDGRTGFYNDAAISLRFTF